MKVSVVVEDGGRKFHGEVELTPQRGTGKPARSVKAMAKAQKPAKVSATAAVRTLWNNGKFKTGRSLSEVEKNLGDLGNNFPKNTLTMALNSAPFLTRRGARGRYRWIQKYKAGE